MSIPRCLDQDRTYKKSSHRKNDSGELDVFEAARYFAGTNEGGAGFYGSTFSHKTIREERQALGGRRMSLDMPMRNSLPSQAHHQVEKQLKEKKYKQPSSPGGRLAKLLNSIFNQAVSKKKKSKSTTQSVKDEDESPGGRRKRRISISHFRSASTTDSKSMFSSSTSGFRTPPPYVNTPIKAHKDMRSYSDHKQVVVPLSKHNGQQVRSMGSQHVTLDEKRNMDSAWLDEKLKFYDGFLEKSKKYGNGSLDKDRMWIDDYSSEKNFRKFDEVDDGGETDSSSDLFELQNYDLGFYSNGLPVYETTHMESIKRGAPIASGI